MSEKYQAANDNFDDVSIQNVVYSNKLTKRNFVSEIISDTQAYMKEVRLSIMDQIEYNSSSKSRQFDLINHENTYPSGFYTIKDVEFEEAIRRNSINLQSHDLQTLQLLDNGLSELFASLTEGTAIKVKEVMSSREKTARSYYDEFRSLYYENKEYRAVQGEQYS